MKQFYEAYKDDEFVSALLTQISWTNHLQIMSGSKSKEERHFYMQLCAKEHYSSRELERQIDSAYYERYMLSSKKLICRNRFLGMCAGAFSIPTFLNSWICRINIPKRIFARQSGLLY